MSFEPFAPESWAMAQRELALSYLDDVSSNYDENVKHAIDALENALTALAANTSEWAKTMLDLGATHLLCRNGSTARHTANAISCFSAALRYYESSADTRGCAECYRGLGKAYARRNEGDGYKHAIEHYHLALQHIAKESWPELWHIVHFELALIYRSIAGNTARDVATLITSR